MNIKFQKGVTSIEYAVIVVAMSGIILAALSAFSPWFSVTFVRLGALFRIISAM